MTAPTTTTSSRSKSKCLLFTIIASLLLLSLIVIILFFILHHKTSHSCSPKSSSSTLVPLANIQLACQPTQQPEICQASLSKSNLLPPNPTPLQIIQSALWVSSQNLSIAQSMLKSLLSAAAGNQNLTYAAKNCLEILGFSQYRISLSNDTLPLGKTKNVRAWMSAAVAYQYCCYGGLSFKGATRRKPMKRRRFLMI
ncbi:probable pectinesterase/pectinesterase inhibitor 64 [Hevea brasiliensis]|uniref:probable pectinesterase/pectinesterase inhibitor 64 n=1 Tax=Hevea brasiliensis TaxID=3981 RepID=UPI0025CF12FF|nr:probable pectinesterase/pectinesterase inhibitor 64 [Hevea brasiliensis]